MATDHDNIQAIRDTIGTGGTGGPSSIANGADVAEGATTDAAVVTDTTGTLSGKLRGLVKWAFERMPAALGQGTMAQSLRVVLASDHSDVPTRAAMGSLTNRSSTITAGGTSQELMAANASRKYFLFVNVSDIDMWIRPGAVAAAASQPSILVRANGGSHCMEASFVSTEAWQVFGATTGKGYASYEG